MHVYGQIISKILIDLNMKIIINLELSPFKLYLLIVSVKDTDDMQTV